MVAVPQRDQVMITSIQSGHQNCHVICLAARVDKICHLHSDSMMSGGHFGQNAVSKHQSKRQVRANHRLTPCDEIQTQ